MVTEEQVKERLEEVLVPGVKRSLVMLNLVRQIVVSGHKVDITLAVAALDESAQHWIKDEIAVIVGKLPDVDSVAVEFVDTKPEEINQIRNIVAIMSGKGGVGKSLIASLVAVALNRQGNQVGILDADITGPSIPRMFGITQRPSGSSNGILPVLSKSGIEVMSFNLLLPQEDDCVIWRGPLISKAVTQFWQEVLWGRLDYLIVDLPPGTADVPLTVMQVIPISGVIVVFTPQDLVDMIVKKAINMAHKMGKSVLGVVENMSYLDVPEIGKKIEIFGRSKGEEMARVANAPLLGQLPIDPELAKLCDQGDIERYNAGAFIAMSETLAQTLSPVTPQAKNSLA
ncbi:MAG: Mrp/NBP35 family ATP-binding protein [Dehalococcoidales bacterium]|nr:Mrp/NBP35 family ATP-binding protein [Dehalococcoidales bacterium]